MGMVHASCQGRDDGGSERRLGRNFEHRPIVVSAALDRGAVEITSDVEDQAGVGKRSAPKIVAEAMQHVLGPSPAPQGRQLEHWAARMRTSATIYCRAVEIAVRIEEQAGVGVPPVQDVSKTMQHLRHPTPARLGRQLEHRTVAVGTGEDRSAVEIAGGIEDQAGLGPGSVDEVVEAM